MAKRDLTEYSDNELSLMVFNEEWLYSMRGKPSLFDTIDEFFIYTDDQLEVLKQDLKDDEGE